MWKELPNEGKRVGDLHNKRPQLSINLPKLHWWKSEREENKGGNGKKPIEICGVVKRKGGAGQEKLSIVYKFLTFIAALFNSGGTENWMTKYFPYVSNTRVK